MRWSLALAGALIVVGAACGGQPAATAPARAAAGQVYVQAAAEPSIWVVDSASGQVVRTLPAGEPSPDWRWLYRLTRGALDVIDPLTGRVGATHPAPDWAQVVHSSANGRWLVLSAAGPAGRFQVQDAAWAGRPIDVSLHGSFTFDGISGDGQRLYVLERLGGDRYHVRMHDVRAGSLAPYVIVDKTDLAQVMSGTALASFTTRSGMMQLTLYQRDAGGHAFVHALPIGQAMQFAFCADLPGPPDGWGFVAAPDGQRFYAVNPAGGRLVELYGDNVGPPGMRQRQIAVSGPGEPAVATSPDGATIYVGTGSGILAVDTGTLTVRVTGLAGQRVRALAAAPGGTGVYAVTGASHLLRLDPHSLGVAGDVTLTGPLGAILRAT